MKKTLLHFFPYLLIFAVSLIQIFCSGGGGGDDMGYESPTQTPQTTLSANDFSATVDENPSEGDQLGTISASTNNGTIRYTLVSQSNSGALDVNATTGVITVADPASFDFETNTTLTAVVRVAVGSVNQDITVTINVTDVNEITGTLWEGPLLTFSKSSGADHTEEANQDRITDNIWITRANSAGQIFNIVVESSADKASSPAGTRWAQGTFADIESVSFTTFRAACPQQKPQQAVGRPMLLHLVEDDIYIEIRFTSWAVGQGQGGFTYERTTPQ